MSPVPARFWRATGGATAVSFALMAGPLLLLAFGGAEFARMMWVREALHETDISTARCMGVLNTNCASGGAYSASGALAYLQTRASGWGISVPSGAVTLDRDAACAGVTLVQRPRRARRKAGWARVSPWRNQRSASAIDKAGARISRR